MDGENFMETPIKHGMIWGYHYSWKHPYRLVNIEDLSTCWKFLKLSKFLQGFFGLEGGFILKEPGEREVRFQRNDPSDAYSSRPSCTRLSTTFHIQQYFGYFT